MDDRIVTAEELAGLLKVSRSHVYSLADAGVIPSLRIGRSRRFLLSEVLAVLRVDAGAA